jgi:hypothetical protein
MKKTMFDEALRVGNARVSQATVIKPPTLAVVFARPCLVCGEAFTLGQVGRVVLTRDEFEKAPKFGVDCGHPEHDHGTYVGVYQHIPRPIHDGCAWVFRATGRAS